MKQLEQKEYVNGYIDEVRISSCARYGKQKIEKRKNIFQRFFDFFIKFLR